MAVADTDLTDITARDLKQLGQLRVLDLKGTGFTDTGLVQFLPHLKSLQAIDLRRTSLSEATLPYLTTSLTTLYLGDTHLSDPGLKHLEHLTRITVLDLSKTEITDEGLRSLRLLKNLKLLILSGTRVSNEGMAQLMDLKCLQELDLRDTLVDSAGISTLSSLPNLSQVVWKADHHPTSAHRDEIRIL